MIIIRINITIRNNNDKNQEMHHDKNNRRSINIIREGGVRRRKGRSGAETQRGSTPAQGNNTAWHSRSDSPVRRYHLLLPRFFAGSRPRAATGSSRREANWARTCIGPPASSKGWRRCAQTRQLVQQIIFALGMQVAASFCRRGRIPTPRRTALLAPIQVDGAEWSFSCGQDGGRYEFRRARSDARLDMKSKSAASAGMMSQDSLPAEEGDSWSHPAEQKLAPK